MQDPPNGIRKMTRIYCSRASDSQTANIFAFKQEGENRKDGQTVKISPSNKKAKRKDGQTVKISPSNMKAKIGRAARRSKFEGERCHSPGERRPDYDARTSSASGIAYFYKSMRGLPLQAASPTIS